MSNDFGVLAKSKLVSLFPLEVADKMDFLAICTAVACCHLFTSITIHVFRAMREKCGQADV